MSKKDIHNYTHKINYFGTELKCYIYKFIEPVDDMVYIGTEDKRKFWWPKDSLAHLDKNNG